jgi:hypothetical protein
MLPDLEPPIRGAFTFRLAGDRIAGTEISG